MKTMNYVKKVTIEEAEAGYSVKELLTAWYVPKHLRGKLRINRGIEVNGNWVSTAHVLEVGDELTLTFDEEDFEQQGPYPANDAKQVSVVFENEDLMVVNKPAGMKMHAHSVTEEDTLLNYVTADLKKRGVQSLGQPASAYMTHRLDRETSGLVIIGKNPLVVPIINRLIKEKKVVKKYHALVSGHFENSQGEFDAPIGREKPEDRLRHVMPLIDGGQSALTSYEVLEAFPELDASLLELTLHTGRMHQLRVHLSNSGHPIVGDSLYGGAVFSRMLLQSTVLVLPEPYRLDGGQVAASLDDAFINEYVKA
ncbi:RluA family pseudouridine synthase [Fructobacillus sp. M2-14]|uniref:RNA pseudouridylate synthase n=1 Tax=Fructobacillus broussonetiae TaxID=2713173 RepID=A0ABS5R3N8_9LACO|nr:RluA family pseudouridine synthase [Fructobacillus broussonetiae]MBS9339179.1 RluA family pseudouridine synthase [Fructobacillus broussonetiae]